MPRRLIHEIHTLIAFGLPYGYVHLKKDALAKRFPGIRHRRFRHSWYCAYGRVWSFTDAASEVLIDRIERVRSTVGSSRAEEYMASVGHDELDRTWDYSELSKEERRSTRKYWEGFYVCILLTPILLRDWAGVDVLNGKIHRVIEGVDVWEDEPDLKAEYTKLCVRAWQWLQRDRKLRQLVELNGDDHGNTRLSDKAMQPSRSAAKPRCVPSAHKKRSPRRG